MPEQEAAHSAATPPSPAVGSTPHDEFGDERVRFADDQRGSARCISDSDRAVQTSGMALYHEVAGAGPAIVFIHEGIADSRMWDPQWASFAARYRLVRCDLAGFGRTPLGTEPVAHARDVLALLDDLGISSAAVVGASLGGRLALELALARPDLVQALVLEDAGIPGVDWSDDVRAGWEAEDDAVARGDLEAATEANLRLWIDGPRRAPADVDPVFRATVATMVRRALELQAPHWEELDEEPLVPDVAERLGEVRAPTLALAGEEDVWDMQELARRFAREIPGARHATIAAAAHMPNLEQPAAFDAVVLPFLGEVLG
jgi:3-oxoadipate enol-lactonase